jgi:dipeptidyl aminopeptidase/acylaminoacyl peptidase
MRPFTPDIAVDLRAPSDVQLAPDGSMVAFCVAPVGHRQTDPTSTIYVVPTDGSAAPRAVTGSEHNNVAPRWSPDGATLAFLSDRVKRGEAQLHRVAASGGEAVRLNELTGGVASPVWRPDGAAIGFTARRRALAMEDEPKSDVKVWSEQWRPHAVASVPAYGGMPRVLGPAAGHVWAFAFSPDGAAIVAAVSPSEDLAASHGHVRLLRWRIDGTDGERELLTGLGMGVSQLQWSADGARILVVASQLPDPSQARVFIIDAADNSVQTLDDGETTPSWAGWQGNALIVNRVVGQVSQLVGSGQQAAGSALSTQYSALSTPPGGWIDSISVAGETVAFTCALPDRPAEVYAARGDESARCLTDLNPQLADVTLAPMEQISWQASDGLRIEGWLLLPPGRAGNAPLPLIVQIHGGPAGVSSARSGMGAHNWGQALAARGYAVLLPNPRGSTGRGAEFTRSNRYDFGGGDYRDIMAGVDHLIAEGIADPDRLGVCGWSYGGFMTAWVVGQTDRFKAAVAGAPPTNWVSKIGTTDIGPANAWNIGLVHQEPDQVWERSPIRYVGKVTTPTLLVGGDADKRVPITQAQEFHWGLKGVGVETELVIYPRQKHGFHERAHQLDLAQRVCDWFARFIPAG